MSTTDTATPLEHRIGATGLVTVRLADWDVEVVGVDGDVARVRSADDRPLPDGLQVDPGPDSITIRQPNRFGLNIVVGERSTSPRLAIEVPVGATAAIATASGDLQVSGLRGPLETRTASGDTRLLDVVGDVQAETVSGDVVIDLVGSTVLAVKTVSGDVLVEGGHVDRFTYTTTSGDLRLTSPLGDGPHLIATVSGDAIIATRSGIRVSAQTVAGDLSSDLPHTSEGKPGRRSLTVGEGSTVVQFRSVSGDLRIVGPNGAGHLAAIPRPPAPPAPPAAPAFVAGAEAVSNAATEDTAGAEARADEAIGLDPATDAARLEVLRALERGEIDVDEATNRLAAVDGRADD
jgi:Toastrack DUF4097